MLPHFKVPVPESSVLHELIQLEPQVVRLTTEEWVDIQYGRQELLIYGMCRYKDVFASSHETRWCYRFMWMTQQFRAVDIRV
jgi:hypothetical protein